MKIVPKRVNDIFINNHNSRMLQFWRANLDFSLTYDLVKVESYVTKYASKSETRSGVFKTAFENVFNEARADQTNTKSALKRVLTKVLGDRDVSTHEAHHLLLGLHLHHCNVTVVKVSLESSRLVRRNNEDTDIEFDDSLVDVYGKRRNFETTNPDIVAINFLEFVLKYETRKGELLKRLLLNYWLKRSLCGACLPEVQRKSKACTIPLALQVPVA